MGQKKSKKSPGGPICSSNDEVLSPRGEKNDDNSPVRKFILIHAYVLKYFNNLMYMLGNHSKFHFSI